MGSFSRNPVAVLTVDDSAQFLEAARELVATTEGFRLVGEAVSGEEGVAAARRLSPDLVLLDVRMPEMDGVETARRLTAVDPRMVIYLHGPRRLRRPHHSEGVKSGERDAVPPPRLRLEQGDF